MESACPTPVSTSTNSGLPSPVQSYSDGTTTRCAAAAAVKVHLRVEQVYAIGGMTLMKPVDSVMDTSQAVNLSVSDWVRNKTAGICPGGSTLMSDGSCSYQ
jgi:hypothetical protein